MDWGAGHKYNDYGCSLVMPVFFLYRYVADWYFYLAGLLFFFFFAISLSFAQATLLERIVFERFNPYNCKYYDRIELLRAAGYSRHHGLIKNAYFNLPFEKDQGFAGKVKVVSIDRYKTKNNSQSDKYSPVTGIFVRWVKNVKTWRFIDEHNHITVLNATDNHPFYVKKLRAFLPIKNIIPEMSIGAGGHALHLLYDDKLNDSRSFNSGRLVRVYNIEVGNRHVYRVGSEGVLVHNCAVDAARVHKKVTDKLASGSGGMLEVTSALQPAESRSAKSYPMVNPESVLMRVRIPHKDNMHKVLNIYIKNNRWVFSNLPENPGADWEYYYSKTVSELAKMDPWDEKELFSIKKISIDFGRSVNKAYFRRYFSGEAGHFLERIQDQFGNKMLESIPVKLVLY